MRKKALFICGSMNQTTQMHKISEALSDFQATFTPYYATGLEGRLIALGLANMTIAGKKMADRCLSYLRHHDLAIDYGGASNDYDLVLTCSDQIIPENIRDRPTVLVQEGMVDPTTLLFHVWRHFRRFPRWLAGTACNGQSGLYDRFCVASEGFRDYFVRYGADPDKIVVTGIPNFDNCRAYAEVPFSHRNYVLVCTSDMRETFKFDNRARFIRRAIDIAKGRKMIFKLHPNEHPRAEEEIRRQVPDALILREGSAEVMVAHADVVVCQLSSLALVALALDKELHSYFDLDHLERLRPLQNQCAAERIASVCRELVPPAATPSRLRIHQVDRGAAA